MKKMTGQQGLTLVELLVSISILAILTTMILGSWFALQKSYAFTTASTEQRVDAREAMARMVRELRDAQGELNHTAVASAGTYSVEYMTTFNEPGTDNTGVNRLTRLQYDPATGKVTRTRDTNGDWAFGAGDRTMLLVENVVNNSATSHGKPPVFLYDYHDSNGRLQTASTVSDPSTIVAVHVQLLVDLQPGKSPQLMDLRSTAQLRNMRQM